jgi:hypothetical protein
MTYKNIKTLLRHDLQEVNNAEQSKSKVLAKIEKSFLCWFNFASFIDKIQLNSLKPQRLLPLFMQWELM